MRRQKMLGIAALLCLPIFLFVVLRGAGKSRLNYRLLDVARSGTAETVEEVRYLLAQGADPNFHDDRIPVGGAVTAVVADGDTPLLLAYKAPVIRLLLDAGADVRLGNRRGETPILRLASSNDDPELLREFIRRGALKGHSLDQVFLTTVACGRPKMAHVLLDLGANPNACFPSGASVLHHAIDRLRLTNTQNEYEAIALLLLSHGARIDSLDDKGATPLQMARKYGITRLVEAMEARARH